MTSQLSRVILKGGANMQIRKGVVADINKKKGSVIVFTMDGDIVEVQTNEQTYKVGDQIFFYEQPKETKHWIRSRTFRYVSGLAAALLLFFASPLSLSDLGLDLGNKLFDKNAYAATLFVESKKSNLKVGLDKKQEITSVKPLSIPSQKVLKEMNWNSDEDINEFLDTYFEEAKKSDYLNSDEPVVISVESTPALGSKKDDLLKEIKTISKKHHVKVVTVAVPDVIVKKAEDFGVTPGKLVVALVTTVKTGTDIPVDKLKKVTIADLVNTVPDAVQALSTYTEEQLAQLAKQTLYVISVPKPQTPVTTTTKTSNNETKSTITTTTNTENVAIDTNNDVQSPAVDSTDSIQSQPVDLNQSTPTESVVDSSSSPSVEQSVAQPQETTVNDNKQQPVDKNNQQPVDNNEQSQETQATQDNQDQGQTQDSLTQEDQTQQNDQSQQDDQTQEEQTQDIQDNQIQDDQAQDEQIQQTQDNQNQDNQSPDQVQNDQERTNQMESDQRQSDNQTSDQQSPMTAMLFKWVNKIIG